MGSRTDLICLVADNNMRESLLGLFPRHRALQTRPFQAEIVVHPEHDPGCFLRAHDFLRPFSNRSRHALVLFDREGCGQDERCREALESDLEERLNQSGWQQRAAAVAIDPELEAWVWSDSPHVARALCWVDGDLQQWLAERDLLTPGQSKPSRPKEAVEKVLRRTHTPRSSSIYRQLASHVSFKRCQDTAFVKLLGTLKTWFPEG